MTRTPLTITLAAAAALAGCNNSDHNIVGQAPGEDTNVTANANVQLPPTVTASKIYRCEDNKIVYVDWLSDNKSANIRTDKTGTPTQVTAAEPGKPMTGPSGYSAEGTASSASVKIGVPGHPPQSCQV